MPTLTDAKPIAPTVPWEDFPHVLRSQQFDAAWLTERFFPLVRRMKENRGHIYATLLEGEFIGVFFFEPSTRTFFSFKRAAELLGARTETSQHMAEFSSAVKGERIEDTIRILEGYGFDAFVIRHTETGGVERAAASATVPVINGGDGTGQHPTQALLDLYTIWERFGTLEGLTVALVGDLLRGRTVHSLAYLMGRFAGTKFLFVSPPAYRMKEDITSHLKRHSVPFEEITEGHLCDVAACADVLYVTRPQKERPGETETASVWDSAATVDLIRVDANVAEAMRKEAIILHPLPRTWEILPEVDQNPRARYFAQAQNGLPVRMALLAKIFHPTRNL